MGVTYIGGGDWISAPLFIVPLTSLTTDPRFAPAANIGRTVQCDDGNQYHCDGTTWRLNLTGGVVDGVTVVRDTELFLQEFATADLPSAALNDRRMLLNGGTDLPVISDGSAWRSLVDEARAAEIAQDVAAAVFRAQTENIALTVGSGTEVEGSHYNTLGAALAYLSQFIPVGGTAARFSTVLIKSGTTLAEQVFIRALDLSHVHIFAEDATVPVSKASLTVHDPINPGFTPFLYFAGGASASIACHFTLTPAYDAGTDSTALIAVQGRSSSLTFAKYQSGQGIPQPVGANGAAGAAGWRNALFARLGYVTMTALDLDDNHTPVLTNGAVGIIGGITTAGYTVNAVSVTGGNIVIDSTNPPVGACDLRKAGSELSTDIGMASGAVVSIREANGLTHRGGALQEPLVQTIDGILYDSRFVALAPYYALAAGLPSASLWPNRFTSTGDEGPVWSNGTNWFPITTGAAL